MEASRVTMLQLADLAIGTPEVGAVNFNALHTLMVALLRRLNLHHTEVDYSRSGETPRSSISMPSLAPTRERKKSLPRAAPQALESQVKVLGEQMKDVNEQVVDFGKQLKTMETQMQGVIGHVQHLTAPWLQKTEPDQEWLEKGMAIMMPEKAWATAEPEKTQKMPRPETTKPVAALGPDQKPVAALGPDQKPVFPPGAEKKLTDLMSEMKPGIPLVPEKLVTTMKPEQSVSEMKQEMPQREAWGAIKEDTNVEARVNQAMNLLQDVIQEVQVLKENIKAQEMKPEMALEKRIENLEKHIKDRSQVLDQVGQSMSMIPVGEDATMVTWEELEQAITDGWKGSQVTPETATAAKLRMQSPLASVDMGGGSFVKRPSFDAAASAGLPVSGPSGAVYEKTPGRDHQHGLVQPGVVQPGADQHGLVQPGVVPPGIDQHGLVQPGVVQPGIDQRGLVQPGFVPPGADQRGLVPPGVVPPGADQHGLTQPGVVPPGADQRGLIQPGVGQPGVVPPGIDQHGLVPPGVVPPGADQRGLVQPGVGQPGVTSVGWFRLVWCRLVQTTVGWFSLVWCHLVQTSVGCFNLVWYHLEETSVDWFNLVLASMVQPGADQHGLVQPGLVPPGIDQSGLLQPGLIQPGVDQHGLIQPVLTQPGTDQRGLIEPGLMQPGVDQRGLVQPVLVQPGTDQRGLVQPGTDQRDFVQLGQPGTDQRGLVQPGAVQHGLVQLGADQRGLVQPGADQPGADQRGLVQPDADQRGFVQPGTGQPGLVQPGAHQLGLVQPGVGQPGQGATVIRGESSGMLYRSSTEMMDTVSEVHSSLEKLAPSFPIAVETLRLIGELIGLYLEVKENMKDLEEQQPGLTDLEKFQHMIAMMVKKSIPPELQEEVKIIKSLAKEIRQEKSKLDRIQRILEGEGVRETGKEMKSSQLGLQLGILRVNVADIEKELAELKESQEQGKISMENSVSEATLYLQDQLDKLRIIIENMLTSSSTLLSMSLPPPSKSRVLRLSPKQIDPEATCPACSVDLGHQVSLLVQRYEQLQDMVNNLAASRPSKKTKLQSQDEELLGHVQSAILQVQGDCEKLVATTNNLLDDHQQKQKDINVLYQGIEKLEREKANREHLEIEMDVKADKSALASKVSRIQFDATTEQLNHMMQELVAKMTGKEQDWQKMVDKLLIEMDSKLNRLELEPVKELLEDRWKSLRKQLKERSPLYLADEAAVMRRQLLAHFHCLSCDRPLETPVTGQMIPVTPVGPSLPGHRSTRPYTIFELEQVRQQSRSQKMGSVFPRSELGQVERSVGRLKTMHSKMLMDIEKVQIHFGGSVKASGQMIRELLQAHCFSSPCYKRVTDMSDYTYSSMPRRCGGSHTLTYPYRRSRLQHLPHSTYPTEEIQTAMKDDEVDILGLDGHIYKGRMDTRLPGILTKDHIGAAKNKSKQSRLYMQRQPAMNSASQPLNRPQSAHLLAASNSGRSQYLAWGPQKQCHQPEAFCQLRRLLLLPCKGQLWRQLAKGLLIPWAALAEQFRAEAAMATAKP
ncbi:PREDICTED: glutamine-rich protein 2 [Elephantulus edwardii]|uniref:glutamine-rich protein 2 n=1 Tax=Elephantulus edwardii TaxID=28737 RepID=UPI0003F069D7|nr:PREDICTED: glutamine-rich protein 2 [Elephantulus edwardii]